MPTFRSVKRRHLRRPARWRASCTACDSSIVVVGWTIPEEDGADSRRERLRGAIWFEGRRRFGKNAGTTQVRSGSFTCLGRSLHVGPFMSAA